MNTMNVVSAECAHYACYACRFDDCACSCHCDEDTEHASDVNAAATSDGSTAAEGEDADGVSQDV